MTASCQQTVCGWLVSPDLGVVSDISVIPFMSRQCLEGGSSRLLCVLEG